VRYFSRFEFLYARWPNADAAALLRESRPMTSHHSAPVLTFTHGDLLKDGSATDAPEVRKPADQEIRTVQLCGPVDAGCAWLHPANF
jgi:hypothetical protein